jgi:hypothetical protein
VSFGTAVITPRWQYVLAGATPRHFGTPVIVDETVETFDVETVAAATLSASESTQPMRFVGIRSVNVFAPGVPTRYLEESTPRCTRTRFGNMALPTPS